jgi:uncharacterized protein YegP (UPF0339 family)
MRFVIARTSNGQFRFNIIGRNGQVIATSETYTRKASAMSTIESIKKSAAEARIDDTTVTKPAATGRSAAKAATA